MTVLLDNTILSNFSILGRPELVQLAFAERVATTHPVFQELQAGLALNRIPACDWEWLCSLPLMESEQRDFEYFSQHLGAGESACLALALHDGYKVATDDKDARRLARQLGIPVSGTLGILIMLVKNQHLTLAERNRMLQKLAAAGYRSPVETLEELLT